MDTTADCPVILDIEASGFGRGHYPIEVGGVLADGSAFCTLVRPEPGWTAWDPAAEAVHGIRREQLLQHGRPAAEVAALLDERLAGLTAYCDAWSHDYAWLHQLYDAAGRSPRFRLESIRHLLDEGDAARWAEAKRGVLARSGLQRHRASSDARILQLTLSALRGSSADAAFA